MKQLVYLSFATKDFDEERDIPLILDSSRDYNPALEVTGMLIYRGGLFLQLIEGPPQSVDSLYRRISQDPRHKNIKIIGANERSERLFNSWTMAYRPLADSDLKKISEILPWKTLIHQAKNSESIDSEAILKILRTFALELGGAKAA